jgi:hypothetical protein
MMNVSIDQWIGRFSNRLLPCCVTLQDDRGHEAFLVPILGRNLATPMYIGPPWSDDGTGKVLGRRVPRCESSVRRVPARTLQA